MRKPKDAEGSYVTVVSETAFSIIRSVIFRKFAETPAFPKNLTD